MRYAGTKIKNRPYSLRSKLPPHQAALVIPREQSKCRSLGFVTLRLSPGHADEVIRDVLLKGQFRGFTFSHEV